MAGHRITHIRRKGLEKRCQAVTSVRMDGRSVPVVDIIKMMRGAGRDRLYHTFYIETEGVRVSSRWPPTATSPRTSGPNGTIRRTTTCSRFQNSRP